MLGQGDARQLGIRSGALALAAVAFTTGIICWLTAATTAGRQVVS